MTPMKKIIRTILIVLGLCILTAAACAETKTAAPFTFEILDEENKIAQIVDYNPPRTGSSSDGIDLTIPAELDGYQIVGIGDNAFKLQRKLKTVVISEGITYIGVRAFSSCDGITRLVLPETLTSIGNRAFSNCKGLLTVTLPASLTSLGENPFALCENLIEVISEGETYTVISILRTTGNIKCPTESG